MDEVKKEDFLKKINSIPHWVQSADDLIKLCRHLQYRLLQNKEIVHWYHLNCSLTPHQEKQLHEINRSYNEAYDNDPYQLYSFEEIIKSNKS